MEIKKIYHPIPCPWCKETPTVSHGKVKCLNQDCPVQPRTKDVWAKGYHHKAVIDWNKMDPMYKLEAPKKRVCQKCGGTGKIKYYHDAGDHFGGGTSPYSEWREKQCDCKSKKD